MKSKALFLLVIFLLNTAVGFACSLHMSSVMHHHHHGSHHDEHGNQHHEHGDHSQDEMPMVSFHAQDDPCCKATVNNLVAQAKLIPETTKVILHLPVAVIGFYHDFSLVPLSGTELPQRFLADNFYRPPIEDIRIAIQSFQI